MHVFVLCLCSCGDAGLGKSAESLTHWPWHHCLKVCHLGMIQEVESVCLVSGGGYGDDWRGSSWNRASEEHKLWASQIILAAADAKCVFESNKWFGAGCIHLILPYYRALYVYGAGSCCNRPILSLQWMCVCVPQRGDLILAPVGQWAHILPSKQPTTQGMVTRHTVFSPLLGWTCQLHPV